MGGKILTFEQNKLKCTEALVGFRIPEALVRIENPTMTRGDFYREMLGIKNTLFISKNEDGSETLIIFVDEKSKCDHFTKLIFTKNGTPSGPYKVPVYNILNILSCENIPKELERMKKYRNNR